MCNLCSSDKKEREAAANDMKYHADKMREFAGLLDAMANGYISPHIPGSALVDKAHAIIRHMVEEYV